MKAGERLYFTTGELARLLGVPKKLLFHYDRIGLFQPAAVLPNGYRYYSFEQLDVLAVIFSLREIGMPLKEIKTYLDQRTPENMLRLFQLQWQKLQEKKAALSEMEDFLARRLALTRQGQGVVPGRLVFEERPAVELTVSRWIVPEDAKEEKWKALREFIQQAFLPYNSFTVGLMRRAEDLERPQAASCAFYYSGFGREKEGGNRFLRPAGCYLTGCFQGPPGQGGSLYRKMAELLASKGYQPRGLVYEQEIWDNICCQTKEEHLTQVSLAVAAGPD